MKRRILLLLFTCLIVSVNAQIQLPKLISDGAILQRDTDLKLWGWASPGEQIKLTFHDKSYTTTADQQGNWHIMLPPQKAGGPYEIHLEGQNKIALKDILFGDVWLCSGQSNMELTMQRVRDKYPEEISDCNYPQIRQFLVPDRYDFKQEHTDLEAGSWIEAKPEHIRNFSAVAYFFAKEIQGKYQVPVGIVNAALGGSPIEAWMSEDALKAFPYAYDELQKFKDDQLIKDIQEQDRKNYQQWYQTLNDSDLGLKRGKEWFLENTKDQDWDEMAIPGFWAEEKLGYTNGAVWFRKQIEVPGNMLGKEAKLWLGRIVDRDSVYVNGQFVGTVGYQYPPRKYTVPANLLKAGKNTIAIRVINESGRGGFVKDKPYFLAVGTDTIDLKGSWKYRLGTTMEAKAGQTFIRWKAGGLYKKMIAPLLNYKIKGALWYQGESNTGAPEKYHDLLPALINNWRQKWQIGEFPFLIVQLTNFLEAQDQPMESNIAELRQAQLNALKVPNTGLAVTIDIGEWNDIHPLNKEDVGKRLALQAQKLAYNEKMTASSPTPKSFKFKKSKVQITFQDTASGLISSDNQAIRHFEISEDGKTFLKANAIIKGKKIIVTRPDISNPVAVRYAWANNPAHVNLYSSVGLPASPFEIRKNK
jgi:sialate O-acetylesterase